MTDITTVTDAQAPVADRPWLDASLPVSERIELLLAEMTVEEKAGLCFHTMIAIGDLDEANPDLRHAVRAASSSRGRLMTHFNLLGAARQRPRASRRGTTRCRGSRASTRLGIPVTLSTDPRHAFSDNPGTAATAGPFSQWPETLGLAAIGDADAGRAVRRHRPPGVHGRRAARRAAPAGRPGDRTALGRVRRRRSARTPS